MAAVGIPAMAEEARVRTLQLDPDTPDRNNPGSDPDIAAAGLDIAAAGLAVHPVADSEQGSWPEEGRRSSGELGRSKPGHLLGPGSLRPEQLGRCHLQAQGFHSPPRPLVDLARCRFCGNPPRPEPIPIPVKTPTCLFYSWIRFLCSLFEQAATLTLLILTRYHRLSSRDVSL